MPGGRGGGRAGGAVLAAMLAGVLLAAGARGQMNPNDFLAGGGGPKAKARKADVPLVICGVCKLLAPVLQDLVQLKRDQLPRYKRLEEATVQDLVETKVCDPTAPEGVWVTGVDLVEDELEGELAVKDMGGPGQCGTECQTVARACREILDDHDIEVAELLWKGAGADFEETLCGEELSGACSNKPPSLPAGRPVGEPWEAKSEEDLKMEQLLASMKGMPGMGNLQA